MRDMDIWSLVLFRGFFLSVYSLHIKIEIFFSSDATQKKLDSKLCFLPLEIQETSYLQMNFTTKFDCTGSFLPMHFH